MNNSIQIERSKLSQTSRTGFLYLDHLLDRLGFDAKADQIFGAPGSNRGIKASVYLRTLIYMMFDGALCLDDVRSLEEDEGLQELCPISYPTSDALGDWLRRYGTEEGHRKLHELLRAFLPKLPSQGVLDIDTTIIAADKGDATWTYKELRGYQPLLGIIAEPGCMLAGEFRQGSHSPQEGLDQFVKQCMEQVPGSFQIVRSDSAGYNHHLINFCHNHHLYFSITADHDSAVLKQIEALPSSAWQKGRHRDETEASWEVAETDHVMNESDCAFRLIVKRKKVESKPGQEQLFVGYHYWIIATNLPEEKYSALQIIHFHQQRGEMERWIGELKAQFNLDHLPCGQITANGLFFLIGLLAFNLGQLLKHFTFGEEGLKKSMRSLRRHFFLFPSMIIHHARRIILRIAASGRAFDDWMAAWRRLLSDPIPLFCP
jgi:hypothetical protein